MNEKQYIIKILNYCKVYMDENIDTLNYFENMLNEIMSEENLATLEDTNKTSATLSKVIQTYANYKNFLSNHKEKLEKLRTGVYNIETPKDLESIKDAYINSISIDIKNIYKFIDLINLYIDVFSSLNEVVPYNDINIISKLVKRLEDINDMSIYEMENLKNGEEGIIKLEAKLRKIKNVLEQIDC